MKEIVVIIRPQTYENLKRALEKIDVIPLTHRRVYGRGKQTGIKYFRLTQIGQTQIEGTMPFVIKELVWLFVEDYQVDAVIETVLRENQTGNIGDGKIFILPVQMNEGMVAPSKKGAA